MNELDPFREAVEFAIDKEQEATEFYLLLAEKSKKRPQMRTVFLNLAKEEQGHKSKLKKILKDRPKKLPKRTTFIDLAISDYFVPLDPAAIDPDHLDYQRALILAMNREKASFRLYTDLARFTKDRKIREIFEHLAQEEARHKLRFEIEYDEHVLKEN